MTPRPRPILKPLSSISTRQLDTALPFAACGRILSPHVRFPPTPSMVVSTHLVHSPQTYDRKPIVVSPNCCDLPRRGERTVHSHPGDAEEDDDRGRGGAPDYVKGSYFHPRAYEACEAEPLELNDSELSPPLLLSDDEYESDSDTLVCTPPDPKVPVVSAAVARTTISIVAVHSPSPPGSPFATTTSPSVRHRGDECSVYPRPARILQRWKQCPLSPTVSVDLYDRWTGLDEGCLGGF